MARTTLTVLIACSMIAGGCRQISSSNEFQVSPDLHWLISVDQIYDGGPGKDGIPALSQPAMTSAGHASYLSDDDLVLGIVLGEEARAYPHAILDWHEIANDLIDGTPVSITYCPLTGSGIAWDRVVSGKKTTFGVSGLLYNSNLIPYDRETDSHWSQMKLQCVSGPLMGHYAGVHKVLETTWKTWKELFPHTTVVSPNTGHVRPYGTYPYGDYKESDRLLFPVSNDDRRLSRKERVLGVIVAGKAKVYPIAAFSDDITVVNDTFNGLPIIVLGSRIRNFAAAYEASLGDEILSFTAVQDKLPVVMVDSGGTAWDVFGRAVEGPRSGAELHSTRSFTAYWFAWAAFHPGVEIHGQIR